MNSSKLKLSELLSTFILKLCIFTVRNGVICIIFISPKKPEETSEIKVLNNTLSTLSYGTATSEFWKCILGLPDQCRLS